MIVRRPPSFGGYAQIVADGTRPSNALGTVAAPGNNTFPAYTNIGVLSSSYDGFGLWIHMNSLGSSTFARDCLVTIGKDDAGGTSFTDWIPYLLASCADVSVWGVNYYFPLRIPAGASLGFKASINNATVGSVRINLITAIQPLRSDVGWYGSFVRTFGETLASSSGTAVTPGGVSEGAWTQLGSAVVENLHYWEFGFGINNAVMNAAIYTCDVGIGDASNKKIAVPNGMVRATAAEVVTKAQPAGGWCDAQPGDLVYGRMHCSTTPDTGISMMAYGVGG